MPLNCAEGWLGHLGAGSPRNDRAGLVASVQSSFVYREQLGSVVMWGRRLHLVD